MAALKIYDGSSWVTLPAGVGVPVGGTANQVLQKINSTNYNTQWATQSAANTSFSPTGTIAATDVQSAIAEVANEYPSNGAWTTFTPTFSSGITAIGNMTHNCAYKTLGDKTVALRVVLTTGTTTTFAAAGTTILLTAPFGTPIDAVLGTGNTSVSAPTSFTTFSIHQINASGAITTFVPAATNDVTRTTLTTSNFSTSGRLMQFTGIYSIT